MARRNREQTFWSEVLRKTEVNAIGDLHGALKAYIGNYVSLELLNQQGWSGGESVVVNLGDILADRYADGIKILMFNSKIASQAESAGGRVVTLAGNHDDFALSYLLGIKAAGEVNPVDMCFEQDQGVGLKEFSIFTSSKGQDFPSSAYARMAYMDRKREEILKNLRTTEKGLDLLEQLYRFKLLEHIDDTLFLHTPPTPSIIQLFLERGIDELNSIFQQQIKMGLGEDMKPTKEFYSIRNVFLHTDNRFTFDGKVRDWKNKDYLRAEMNKQIQASGITSKKMAEKLQESGINQIVYGHNSDGGSSEIFNGVRLTGIDYTGAFKTKNSKERSILRISRDGSTFVGVQQSNISKVDTVV